jgi:hypothetical protein
MEIKFKKVGALKKMERLSQIFNNLISMKAKKDRRCLRGHQVYKISKST